MLNTTHECLDYGTSRCETCSEGMRAYCERLHQKLQDGTFNLADDYWDYIELVVNDDDDDF